MGTFDKLKHVNGEDINIVQVKTKAAKKTEKLGVIYGCEGN